MVEFLQQQRKRVRKGSSKRRSTYDLEFVFAESERLKGKNVKQKILNQGLSTEGVSHTKRTCI